MANTTKENEFPQGDKRQRQVPPRRQGQEQGQRPRPLQPVQIQYPSRHQVETTIMPRAAHTSFRHQISAPTTLMPRPAHTNFLHQVSPPTTLMSRAAHTNFRHQVSAPTTLMPRAAHTSFRHQVSAPTTLMPRPAHTNFRHQVSAPPYQVYGQGPVPYNNSIPLSGLVPRPPHAAPIYGHGHGHGYGLYDNISFPPVPATPIHCHGLYNNISSPSESIMLYPGPRIPPPPSPHHQEEGERLTRPQHQLTEARQSEKVALTPELTGFTVETMIQQPVHYWFSQQNLQEDDFLKQKMDAEGWVPISVIITFNSLANIENINCSLVAESLRDSPFVEVRMEDLMIRKRGDWFNYLPQLA